MNFNRLAAELLRALEYETISKDEYVARMKRMLSEPPEQCLLDSETRKGGRTVLCVSEAWLRSHEVNVARLTTAKEDIENALNGFDNDYMFAGRDTSGYFYESYFEEFWHEKVVKRAESKLVNRTIRAYHNGIFQWTHFFASGTIAKVLEGHRFRDAHSELEFNQFFVKCVEAVESLPEIVREEVSRYSRVVPDFAPVSSIPSSNVQVLESEFTFVTSPDEAMRPHFQAALREGRIQPVHGSPDTYRFVPHTIEPSGG